MTPVEREAAVWRKVGRQKYRRGAWTVQSIGDAEPRPWFAAKGLACLTTLRGDVRFFFTPRDAMRAADRAESETSKASLDLRLLDEDDDPDFQTLDRVDRLRRWWFDLYHRLVGDLHQLYSKLTAAGFTKFAARVANGEFDATKEESDEWARSPEGQEIAKQLSPEMRQVLGMDLKN